jgi:hypothetical protein
VQTLLVGKHAEKHGTLVAQKNIVLKQRVTLLTPVAPERLDRLRSSGREIQRHESEMRFIITLSYNKVTVLSIGAKGHERVV